MGHLGRLGGMMTNGKVKGKVKGKGVGVGVGVGCGGRCGSGEGRIRDVRENTECNEDKGCGGGK